MAILHQATLAPSKLEILSKYLVTLPAHADTALSDFALLGSYRFDDPTNEVGIETHLLTSGSGPVSHVPLTYRAAPMVGAEEWLIATMEHSVLGSRWVYNACGDPVYVAELARAILTGGTQVEQFVETDDGPVVREPSATVAGSGSTSTPVPAIESVVCEAEGNDTVIRSGAMQIVVRHLLTQPAPTESQTLSGQWEGIDTPTTLAFIR